MTEYTGRQFFKNHVTGKKQSDGAFSMDVSDSLYCGDFAKRKWTIQVVCNGSPSAGTLTVGAKVPGASEHADMSDTIDLSSGSPAPYTFEATVESLEFTPDSYDGDSFDVFVAAS